MKKLILSFLFSGSMLALYAQQDPIYAQYLLNPIVINPAHAGVNNNLTLNASYRTQWTALEGQPKTLHINGSISLAENRIGIGVNITQDKLGAVTNGEFNGVVSYRLHLGNQRFISFGMQAGVMNFKNDYSALTPYDVDDPAFSDNGSATRFNIGAGVIFRTKKLTLGLSVPRMLPATIKTQSGSFAVYKQHYYLFAGYAIEANPNLCVQPTVLLRKVEGASSSVDLGVNFHFHHLHTAGLFTRNLKSCGVLLQTRVKERLRFGYVFEIPVTKNTITGFTTHEFTVGLLLAVLKNHDTKFKPH
ncbi:PorP/SprF family type IX secretion system membrane protein [Pseudochryseolinea flava]|uniref:Type IX secretion system membrane protein PorP/SprF n=1 Tax=Pseudochryseolinea flava TaxID=2059302 RepID=A0A364XVI2_9BACT|nr:type IX secretion system membrane protein PorP/SprF [Pseudochryseolinea flava]RAV97718.1 hypothetical protein DQQ10_27145 [Pseudochryseolinea flava]